MIVKRIEIKISTGWYGLFKSNLLLLDRKTANQAQNLRDLLSYKHRVTDGKYHETYFRHWFKDEFLAEFNLPKLVKGIRIRSKRIKKGSAYYEDDSQVVLKADL